MLDSTLSALSLLPPILYNHAAQGLCPDVGKEGLGPDVQIEIHSAKLNLNFREITDHFNTRMPHAVLGTHLYYTIIWNLSLPGSPVFYLATKTQDSKITQFELLFLTPPQLAFMRNQDLTWAYLIRKPNLFYFPACFLLRRK